MKYLVYGLFSSLTKLPFYVGKTYEGSSRPQNHIKWSKEGWACNPFLLNELKKLDRLQITVQVEILYRTDDENEAYQEEIKLIAKYGRRCNKTGILTNISPGGRYGGSGMTGRKHSSKTIEKMKEAQKKLRLPGGLMNGRKRSQESIQKCINSRKWYRHSLATREKSRLSHIGKYHSLETRSRMSLQRGGTGKIWTIEEAREEVKLIRTSWSYAWVKYTPQIAQILWEEGLLTHRRKYPYEMNDEERKEAGWIN